jgi:hypothetical protein
MSAITVGTEPVQVAPRNPRRHSITVQLLPNNIAAGNTGLVFGKFGSAPYPTLASNSWDFVLNAGALDGSNLYEANNAAVSQQELWLCADTAGQSVNVVERSIPETASTPSSGAAAV